MVCAKPYMRFDGCLGDNLERVQKRFDSSALTETAWRSVHVASLFRGERTEAELRTLSCMQEDMHDADPPSDHALSGLLLDDPLCWLCKQLQLIMKYHVRVGCPPSSRCLPGVVAG